jgi:hypothetical protein
MEKKNNKTLESCFACKNKKNTFKKLYISHMTFILKNSLIN